MALSTGAIFVRLCQGPPLTTGANLVSVGSGGAVTTDLTFFDALATSSSLEQRPVYVGVYTTSANLAAFLAPLLGTQIAAHWGLGPALVVGGVLRLLGFGLLLLLRIGASPVLPLQRRRLLMSGGPR